MIGNVRPLVRPQIVVRGYACGRGSQCGRAYAPSLKSEGIVRGGRCQCLGVRLGVGEAPQNCVIHFEWERALLVQQGMAPMMGFGELDPRSGVVLSGFPLLRAWELLELLADVHGAILQLSEACLSIREAGQRRLALVQAHPRRGGKHTQFGLGLTRTGRRSGAPALVFAQIRVAA